MYALNGWLTTYSITTFCFIIIINVIIIIIIVIMADLIHEYSVFQVKIVQRLFD